jgi:hypothetical protein
MSLAAPTIPREPDPSPHVLLNLRSQIVSPELRACHPEAHARELAPGLHELVAIVRPHGYIEVPTRDELRRRGVDDPFPLARAGTCSEPLEFGRAGPLPGVHAHVLGGPGGFDTAAAVFALADQLAAVLGPAGLVASVPVRGMALFASPRARGITRALARFGRQRQFWTSDPTPGQISRLPLTSPARMTVQFLASWTGGAHTRFADPVSPALYWHRPGHPLSVLVRDVRRPYTLPDEFVALTGE